MSSRFRATRSRGRAPSTRDRNPARMVRCRPEITSRWVVPVRWKFTIPFGILHAPTPSPTVERFLEAIQQVTGAGEELPGGR